MRSKSYILIIWISVSLGINVQQSSAVELFAKVPDSAAYDHQLQRNDLLKYYCQNVDTFEGERVVNRVIAAKIGDQRVRGLSESGTKSKLDLNPGNSEIRIPSLEKSKDVQVNTPLQDIEGKSYPLIDLTQNQIPERVFRSSRYVRKTPYNNPNGKLTSQERANQNYSAIEVLGVTIMNQLTGATDPPQIKLAKKFVRRHSKNAIASFIYAMHSLPEGFAFPTRQDLGSAIIQAASDLEHYWDQFNKYGPETEAQANNPFFVSQEEDQNIQYRLEKPTFAAAASNSICSGLFLKWLKRKVPAVYNKVHNPRTDFLWIPQILHEYNFIIKNIASQVENYFQLIHF